MRGTKRLTEAGVAASYFVQCNRAQHDFAPGAQHGVSSAISGAQQFSLLCDELWDDLNEDATRPAESAAGVLERWRDLGVERVFVSLGGADMPARLRQLLPLIEG